jgi:hypothetical protein
MVMRACPMNIANLLTIPAVTKSAPHPQKKHALLMKIAMKKVKPAGRSALVKQLPHILMQTAMVSMILFTDA